ncbi:MAG: hypothetical protein QOF78_92 [Phycisphaerales bacterium]|jgi:hypothetical protein|nr:hypothetical protein [Phycisphaerales bacterium]
MRTVMLAVLIAMIGCTSPKERPKDATMTSSQWRPLFNGKDLSGWETWLGRPHMSVTGVDLPKDEKGQYVGVVGLNNDPKRVYSVVEVDGAPAIRISGEIFGALTTTEEFENYCLKFEFKWGDEKFEPRTKAMRDSGILYHCVGPHGGPPSPSGGGSRAWMQSHECQIQERDTGDYWSVADAIADIEAEPITIDGKHKTVVYKPGAEKWTIPNVEKLTQKRAIKSLDNEKPSGEWNTVEIICVGGNARHVINGKENMVITNSRRKVDGQEIALTKGRLQFQSEGAEVFYRNIMVRSDLSK